MKIISRKLTSLEAESLTYSIENNGNLRAIVDIVTILPEHHKFKYYFSLPENEYYLLIQLKHSIKRIFDGKIRIFKPGNYMIVNPGTKYTNCIKPAKLTRKSMCIIIRKDVFDRILTDYKILPNKTIKFQDKPEKINKELGSIINSMNYFLKSINKKGSLMLFDSVMQQIACYLLIYHKNDQDIGSRIKVENIHDDERIDKAVEYLRENYFKKITLKELSEASRISKFQFVRTFKKITGKNPWQFLTDLRIAKSVEMIKKDPHIRVKEISKLVGYKHPEYFERIFFKRLNKTPRALKNEILQRNLTD